MDEAAELLRRRAPAGVSIEPQIRVLDEDGGVETDDEAPVRLRAWLPADGDATRDAVAALRRDLRALGDAVVRPLRTRTTSDSWAEAWKRHHPVLRIGRRLVLRPTWRRYRPCRGDVVVELDPGLAFGTGQHATTRMCLEALEARLAPGAAVLDVGCGSGVLAVAAALLGAASADAIDIDPAAVQATNENAARNGVERIVRAARGSLGETWPFAEAPDQRYDLVVANLNARLVRELARSLVAALRPGGAALLSGVIEEQGDACCLALAAAGARLVEMREDGGWLLLAVAVAGPAGASDHVL